MDQGTFEWLARVEAKMDYIIDKLVPKEKKKGEGEQ